jgi:hypothetical protein
MILPNFHKPADTFFVQNAFMAQKQCTQGDFLDPPPYEKGEPEDPED